MADREISGEAMAELRRDRSKFYALVLPPMSVSEREIRLKAWRKSRRKAGHHPFAWRALDDGRIVEAARDDREVGRPGQVLLELLRGRGLLGTLIVSRVYGGVKMGSGGVARAVRDVARMALEELD